MEKATTVTSAVPYRYNDQLVAQAVACRAHFLDLSGNNAIVTKELKLHDDARERGRTIIPDCSLAPGMANILAYHLHGTFDEVENLHIRVGGLPLEPHPPLDYQLLFSVQGLINEYIEPCEVIHDGKIENVRLCLEKCVWPGWAHYFCGIDLLLACFIVFLIGISKKTHLTRHN
jgi:lysine 6-dehydrogenase